MAVPALYPHCAPTPPPSAEKRLSEIELQIAGVFVLFNMNNAVVNIPLAERQIERLYPSMSDAYTTNVQEETAERERRISAERSAAARLMASANRGKPRRRPTESLTVAVPIDARTHAGRAAHALRTALLAQIGPKPAPAKLAIVQQLIQLKLRLGLMDHNFIAAGGVQSAHDAGMYLAWSNSYVRGLKALGLESVGAAVISLADALAAGAPHTPPAAPPGRAGAQAAGAAMPAHSAGAGPG